LDIRLYPYCKPVARENILLQMSTPQRENGEIGAGITLSISIPETSAASLPETIVASFVRLEPDEETTTAYMALIRVLVVDDHEVARRGIRSVLSSDASLAVVWEAADGEEAVKRAAEFHPAIILLDISLPGMSGIQAARRIRVVSPESRIIFLSQHDSVQIAKDALSAGAEGYVVKSDAGLDLLNAIQTVHQGQEFVSRTLIARGWS
jgi:CheY-like chemotaxis protein